jgi:hypothetical protein
LQEFKRVNKLGCFAVNGIGVDAIAGGKKNRIPYLLAGKQILQHNISNAIV